MVTNWTGVKSISDKDIGFTYIVENLISGKRYVGSKVLYKPDGKPSNWKTYKTSSKYLKEDMNKSGEDNFRFRIISFHENIEEMYELEQFTQETLDVLRSRLPNGELEFYNKRINGKACISKVEDPVVYEEVCRKISKKTKERLSDPENHPMKGRVHPNKGKKLPQTGHNKNLGKRCYTNGVENIRRVFGEEPDGFWLGLTMCARNTTRNKPRRPSTYNQQEKFIKQYNENPRICEFCESPNPYEKRWNKFCGNECYTKSSSLKVKGKANPISKQTYITPKGEFDSLIDLASAYNMSAQGVIWRCKSKSEKYKDYYIKLNNDKHKK